MIKKPDIISILLVYGVAAHDVCNLNSKSPKQNSDSIS